MAKKSKGLIVPQDYRRNHFALSPSSTKQSKATLPQYLPRRPRVLARQDCCLSRLSSVLVGKPSNHDSLPPWPCSRWLPSWSRGPLCQTRLTRSVAGSVWTRASPTTVIQSVSADTHYPESWHMAPRPHVERRALGPRKHWDRAHQWSVPKQPAPHSRCCSSDLRLTHRPNEKSCCPSTEWGPGCVHPASKTQCYCSHDSSPQWSPCSKYGGKCRWGWLIKNETTMHNQDDYVQYGKRKALTNTSSRENITSMFTHPANSMNWNQSWLKSS